jgi:hypothetical protein
MFSVRYTLRKKKELSIEIGRHVCQLYAVKNGKQQNGERKMESGHNTEASRNGVVCDSTGTARLRPVETLTANA